jgi:hypothetical protein
MKMNFKTVMSCNTIEDLQQLGLGLTYKIGGNTGYLGLNGALLANAMKIDADLLPMNFGVYHNYLGGGMKGSLIKSSFSDSIPENKKQILVQLLHACQRAFLTYENDLYDDNADDWDRMATDAARAAGIQKAY